LNIISGRFAWPVFPFSWRHWYLNDTCLENRRRRPVSSKSDRKILPSYIDGDIALTVFFRPFLHQTEFILSMLRLISSFSVNRFWRTVIFCPHQQELSWVTNTHWAAVITTSVLNPNEKSMMYLNEEC
jgi:hypothetical protein